MGRVWGCGRQAEVSGGGATRCHGRGRRGEEGELQGLKKGRGRQVFQQDGRLVAGRAAQGDWAAAGPGSGSERGGRRRRGQGREKRAGGLHDKGPFSAPGS